MKIHYRIHKNPPVCTLSNPFSLIYILIFSSHLGLGFPSGLFPSGFLYIYLRSLACFMHRHRILLHLTIIKPIKTYSTMQTGITNFVAIVTTAITGHNQSKSNKNK
jgi:hypothetical protein